MSTSPQIDPSTLPIIPLPSGQVLLPGVMKRIHVSDRPDVVALLHQTFGRNAEEFLANSHNLVGCVPLKPPKPVQQAGSYTITAIIQLWQPGNTQDPRVGIQSVLEVFHHPFNCKPDSMVQVLMLKEVRGYIRESLNSDPQAFESTLHSLSASAVASRIDPHCGGHTHVDVRPTSAGTGTHGSSMLSREHSPLLTYQLSENIKDQLNQGKIKGKGIVDFAEIEKMLFADPSGDSPNPLDSALSTIPGLSFLDAFQGIEMSQIAAVEGIGETLKDAIVTMVLLDETRGAHEEEIAASKFGMGKHMNKKEQKARLKELTSLLELKRIYVPKEEEKGDDGLSMGEKLKLKMEKLKLKARS